jgi:hypothetical protein
MIMHEQLMLKRDELSYLAITKLDSIIQSENFKSTPKEIREKILNLRDIIDRY